MNTLPNDPILLFSVINTKLRDAYRDIDTLCEDMQIERAALERTLSSAGFIYNAEKNRFE